MTEELARISAMLADMEAMDTVTMICAVWTALALAIYLIIKK